MKNKDVDQSKLVTLNTPQVITGYKQFTQPIQADKFIKIGGTDNQILLANGDTIDKDKLAYEPIESATSQAVAYGMYEQLLWGTLTTQNSRVHISVSVTHSQPNTYWNTAYTVFSIVNNDIKPKFSGTPHNISLNAIMYNTKQPTTPVPQRQSHDIRHELIQTNNSVVRRRRI
ncbi:MAG: hypothetical protein EZS28_027628, partial [Streblomastix strix]